MAHASPLRSSFRELIESPSLVLGEIAWRWGFGLVVWAVIFYTALTFLAGIKISDGEWRVLKSLEPYSMALVLAQILADLGPMLGRWIPAVIPVLMVLWVVLASIGRAATLKALLQESATNWLGLLGINTLRVVVLLAAVLAFFGGGILIGAWIPPSPEKQLLPTLLIFLVALVVGSIWSMLNWFLSLAPIFALRDGRGGFASFRESVELFRSYPGRYTTIAAALGLMRSVLLGAILLASLAVVGAAAQGQWRGALTFSVIVSLIYFAMTDFLHIWRIAAYVKLAEAEPEIAPEPAVLPSEPLLPPAPQFESDFGGGGNISPPPLPEGQ
ncbi:MAG TPA: hypothetical protein VEG30_15000 [Terriglobales bacterium]|nr:hypothetical protein [Terriglobales bacterium]